MAGNAIFVAKLETICEKVIEFLVKNMVILDSGGNYLHVKEVAGSFTKIGAPLYVYWFNQGERLFDERCGYARLHKIGCA